MEVKKTIVLIAILFSLAGCQTSRYCHFASEIGDSIFIYMPIPELSSVDKEITGRLSEYNNHATIGYHYAYWIRNDSIYIDDQIQLHDPWPIKKTKKQITIYRTNNNDVLFYKRENIDSIVLWKVCKSYLNKMNKKYHIVIY